MPWTTIEFGDAQIDPGKPRYPLNDGLGALRRDEALGGFVEVGGRDAGMALGAQHSQAARLDRAGGGHRARSALASS